MRRRPTRCAPAGLGSAARRAAGRAGSGTSGGIGLREALAAQHLEQHLGVPAGHVGVGLALLRLVAEVSPALDHLLRRAAADPQLEAATEMRSAAPASSAMYSGFS